MWTYVGNSSALTQLKPVSHRHIFFLHNVSNSKTASHAEQAGLGMLLHFWSYHTENTSITQLRHKDRNQMEAAVNSVSYSLGRSLGMTRTTVLMQMC